jgi:hypothetical protein
MILIFDASDLVEITGGWFSVAEGVDGDFRISRVVEQGVAVWVLILWVEVEAGGSPFYELERTLLPANLTFAPKGAVEEEV